MNGPFRIFPIIQTLARKNIKEIKNIDCSLTNLMISMKTGYTKIENIKVVNHFLTFIKTI